MRVCDVVTAGAARHGDRPALITPARTLTYRELDELSAAVAGGLQENGLRAGDVVSLYSENRWEWLVAYHATLRAGGVVNPLNVMLTPSEVAYATADCGAVAIMGSAAKIAPLAGTGELPTVQRLVCFDDPAAGAEAFAGLTAGPPRSVATGDESGLCSISYTSGTTGHPKGAMQSHRAVLLNSALTATMHVRVADDVLVTALPLPHVYGNVAVHSILLAGGTVVLMERFDAGEALELIGRHGATLFEGVPTMYAALLSSPELGRADLRSLRRCTVGGQTMPVETMAEWERRCAAPLLELWGMTEIAGLGTTHSLYAPNVHGSIGVALPGVQVRLGPLDGDGADPPAGEAGELMVRGPIVMDGYFGNPTATAEVLDPHGWLRTGDVATMDPTGHCYVVDRRKDMIITAGYNVYPAEIERVLATHPAVSMVAVGAQPDPVKGELARAYVVLRPGARVDERDLVDHCRERLAAYKLPRSVRFVDDLPKTSSGKIMRRLLSELD